MENKDISSSSVTIEINPDQHDEIVKAWLWNIVATECTSKYDEDQAVWIRLRAAAKVILADNWHEEV